MAWKKIRDDLWEDRQKRLAVNISTDSSNRYWVQVWNLNRSGGTIYPAIEQTDPLGSHSLAVTKAKQYMRKN